MNRSQILRESIQIHFPTNIIPELRSAYQISRYCHDYILSYLQEKVQTTNSPTEEQISLQFDNFVFNTTNSITEIFNSEIPARERNKNIFSFSGSTILYKINHYSRSISTNLAICLDQIVFMAPNVFSTEVEFENLKITGVDAILLINDQLHYVQLKTKKDTLTGSQSPRSNAELAIHDRSIFAALLPLGAWTFNTTQTGIQRLQGIEFWRLINIDYNIITRELIRSINEIETHIAQLQASN